MHARSCRLGPRPAKPPAHLASLGDELAIALELHLDDAQAGTDALADLRAFELSEGAGHLKKKFAGRGGGIDRLLVQVEIDADRFEILDRAEQIDQSGLGDQWPIP